jgi:ADP-heptose:LPS heptosyltransferase
MKLTIVIRLSSLGDVALLIPALYPLASANSKDRFLLLTKKTVHQLFINPPANLEVFAVDAHGRHKGIPGLFRLVVDLFGYLSKIKKSKPGKLEVEVADMHDVMRSQVVRFLLRLRGAKVAVIDKNRKAKRELTRRHNKHLTPLKPSFERYCDVFQQLGFTIPQPFTGVFPAKPVHEGIRIGIAPFARHATKIYPPQLMEQVIDGLLRHPAIEIVFLGGRDEASVLDAWAAKRPRTQSVAGQLNFPDELALINGLDVVVSMDSANMHLASLAGVPVVSVWGGTHPYAGFYGYGQNPKNAVQIELDCRPCSVFGCARCRRNDFACLRQIDPEMIVQRVMKVIVKRD